MADILDCLIIGGGPGGLSAALTMARQLHTCVVFDSQDYRNASASNIHTVLTWDRKDVAEFRKAAEKNIEEGYDTIKFVKTTIQSVAKAPEGSIHSFEAKDEQGKTWLGRKIILAPGCVDVLPDTPGYAECWGRGIYHCLFCHGYEDRGKPSSGVLATGDFAAAPIALYAARYAVPLSKKVRFYTDGNSKLVKELEAALEPGNDLSKSTFDIDDRKIQRFEKIDGGIKVHFNDASEPAIEAFIAHKTPLQIRGPFAKQLNLELTPMGDIKTTPPFYQTSVRGVFAAGDPSDFVKIANAAMFTGSASAAEASSQIHADKLGHPSLF